jgi:hypothetical protein
LNFSLREPTGEMELWILTGRILFLERVITPMLISPYQVVTKKKYFFSGAYNTEGIINSNALERITARTNVSQSFRSIYNWYESKFQDQINRG